MRTWRAEGKEPPQVNLREESARSRLTAGGQALGVLSDLPDRPDSGIDWKHRQDGEELQK